MWVCYISEHKHELMSAGPLLPIPNLKYFGQCGQQWQHSIASAPCMSLLEGALRQSADCRGAPRHWWAVGGHSTGPALPPGGHPGTAGKHLRRLHGHLGCCAEGQQARGPLGFVQVWLTDMTWHCCQHGCRPWRTRLHGALPLSAAMALSLMMSAQWPSMPCMSCGQLCRGSCPARAPFLSQAMLCYCSTAVFGSCRAVLAIV